MHSAKCNSARLNCSESNTCLIKPRTAPVPTPTSFLVDAKGNVNNDVAIGLGVTALLLCLVFVLAGVFVI